MYNLICDSKVSALLTLDTIGANMKSGTPKQALRAVSEWIKKNNFDDYSRLTPEQRKDRILEIETHLRDCMTDAERKEKAAFYLQGVTQ